jgi:hypothetical protein
MILRYIQFTSILQIDFFFFFFENFFNSLLYRLSHVFHIVQRLKSQHFARRNLVYTLVSVTCQNKQHLTFPNVVSRSNFVTHMCFVLCEVRIKPLNFVQIIYVLLESTHIFLQGLFFFCKLFVTLIKFTACLKMCKFSETGSLCLKSVQPVRQAKIY